MKRLMKTENTKKFPQVTGSRCRTGSLISKFYHSDMCRQEDQHEHT
jgi:hypothetical protein